MTGSLLELVSSSVSTPKRETSHDVVEISLLLPAIHAKALLSQAQQDGVTFAQMMRRIVRKHLLEESAAATVNQSP